MSRRTRTAVFPLAGYWNLLIHTTELVRHTLAHTGGRFRTNLEKYKARFVEATGTAEPILRGDLFVLMNGKIQITPDNTRHLFSVLKERVSKIVEEVA